MANTEVEENDSPTQRLITLKDLPSTYFHLSLIRSGSQWEDAPPLDLVTVRAYLTAALQQFLGLTGAAIPIDILKVENNDTWIRAPGEDGRAIQGALSQWVGKEGSVSWRIHSSGAFIGSVSAGDGSDLFDA